MKKHTSVNILIIIFMLLSSFAISPVMISPSLANTSHSIHYAQPDGQIIGDCSSWENACDLQYALSLVTNMDQIWVTEGVYYPGDVSTDTFRLKDGVALYGGFPLGGGDWVERDWSAHPTILSGDVDHNDLTEGGVVKATDNIIGTNSYHVVTSMSLTSTILDGFTITAGNANSSNKPDNYGGGIYIDGGTVTLTNITFSGNRATFYGGGMSNMGNAILTNVTFSGNSVTGDICGGGGMYNNGNVTLTDGIFSGNESGDLSFSLGGGLYNDRNGNATITDVTFSDNTASGDGGGIGNYKGAAKLTNVIFSSNSSINGGGGMISSGGITTLTNVTFSDNYATERGGGLFNYEDSSQLTNVTFLGNSSYYKGGGMFNAGNTKLNHVTFNGNSALAGGGMYNVEIIVDGDTATLTNVTFQDNEATNGGGMYIDLYITVNLSNITFSSNKASESGGGVYIKGDPLSKNSTFTNVTFSSNQAVKNGGGMYNFASKPTLNYVTFANNQVTQNGGGLYNSGDDIFGGSLPILTNAILWENSPDQIYSDVFSFVTVTYSDIQGDWEGEGNINLDPLLDPLADNGGFTLTHALEEGSPAIDIGSPATYQLTDQRDYLRTFDGDGDGVAVCDMGAFEYGSIPPLMQYLSVVVK